MMYTEDEPIALIGIGCRLPGGATDPNLLWQLLEQGVDAVGPVPADRWDRDRFFSPKPQQPGRLNAREGGFLDAVDTFDAAFFGISGRIAEQMDPQQRLLLEVTWEALENAGVVPDDLAGSRTGVFVGACSQDYGTMQSTPSELTGLGPHSATGTFMSIVSNRLSYTFDLRGPSMTVDTACSSSLVAVHLAVESLRRGESDQALAGGVNLMLTPQFGIALSQAAMLSPDGRSRAFDASANGYVRGEGAGVVVLKPLSQARLDGDRVYAVIRGAAVNQDGRTQGITVPNGESQEANFHAALAAAGVRPADVGYVEAHGTGTPVGDPIEANALGRVLAVDRDPDRTALIGSIKTNIGHLEAAAGIAGLIKAALCVQRRSIPASLHFRQANPDIDLAGLPIAVATAAQPWPTGYPVAVASVNSFGFGGTNANVVLAEPEPAVPDTATADRTLPTPTVLTLSARSTAALDTLAASYAHLLETRSPDLEGLGAAVATRRTHHEFRRAVVAADAAEAAAKLLAGATISGQVQRGRTGRVVFLCNGQGPQWYAMGRTLLETSPIYRAKILECDAAAGAFLDWSIHGALTADEASSRVGETHVLQPTMFAVQVALADLWRSWGIVPDAVLGHSMGEIAAAHISGALSLSEALRIICHRARIQEKADPTGAMMFVALSAAEAEELCARQPDALWVSAINSPRASTLSGRRHVLEALAADLAGRGVFARILRVNCACHSQDMEPLRDELLTALAGLRHGPAAVPMYSTLTGARIEGTELGTDYWWRNFRMPVQFEPAVRAMLADGYDTFIELSPHPVLANSVTEITGDALVLPSLVRQRDDWTVFLDSFARMYTAGVSVDWRRRYPDGGSPMLDLPANPWVRQRFWNESVLSTRQRTAPSAHPMLRPVDGARPTWEIDWNDSRLAWIREHDVFGSVIVPGAAFVEAALAAAREHTGGPCALEFVKFERACVLSDEPQVSRVEIDPEDGTFEFHQRAVRGDTWLRNARGRFHRTSFGDTAGRTFDPAEIRDRCRASYRAVDVYGRFAARGYAYGPAFCGITDVHIGVGETLARIGSPRVLRKRLGGYLIHPAILDACFQSAILHPTEERPQELLPISYLPTGIGQVRLYREISVPVWCYSRLRKNDDSLIVDIHLLGESGELVAEFTELTAKAVRWHRDTDRVENHIYALTWQRSRSLPPERSALTMRPAELAAEIGPRSGALAERVDRRAYTGVYQRDVARLCAAYVTRCLELLGLDGEFVLDDVPGLLPKYRRAFQGMLRLPMAEGGVVESGDRFRIVQRTGGDPESLWAELFSRHPACAWELLLLRQTGRRLHDVLVGSVDPLELLFADDALADAEAIYQNSPIARYYNLLAGLLVERLSESADPRRTLRVLEVGGGTGGMTASLLPVLPAQRCEYVFSDVSAAFLGAARERFRDFHFVDYRVLDLEHDPATQDFEDGTFDLVVASDVVHATADVKKTLLFLQDMLVPGGALLLLEATPDNPWLDLTFGLTDGWWSFRDQRLRPEGPLLTGQAWQDLLYSVDFDDVAVFGAPGPGSQTVLLARTPEAPPRPVSVPDQVEKSATWLILADSDSDADPLGAVLAARIDASGDRAVLAYDLADCDPDELAPAAVVDVRGGGGLALDTALTESSVRLVDLVRAMQREGNRAQPRLYVVTRGAHAFRNEQVDLSGAAAWGLGAVVGLESPQLRYTVIDVDPEPSRLDVDAVWAELHTTDHEREILWRAGERFVRRLVPRSPEPQPMPARRLPGHTGFALTTASPGALDGLHYRAGDRIAPAAGQVEIEVVAAGLNFLDVMIALGQVPPLEATAGYRFGAECAGVVTRVGPGVEDIAVGDPVVAVHPGQGTLATHLTLPATHVASKPATLSFEAAGSVPIAFLTAWYALHRLARLGAGERVLIHAGSGGTGMAAVQLAQLAGAEVFATAGSRAKRELLRALGVRHVFDSRSLEFADEVLAATDGTGVDVVVNSLAGEAVSRSIACLASYGRFVELGKRDLLQDRALGLRPFLRNLAYFSFDLRQLLVDRPEEVHAALEALMRRFAAGELRPVPYRIFHPSQTEAAFRHLAAARHIGKVVLAMDERQVDVVRPPDMPAVDGTWLITGGLGGVGLAMADRLADLGVRSLALVGRSGVSGDQAAARVAELRQRGVRVLAEAVDVGSRTEVVALLAGIERELPPLRGILHCAMVLDDARLADMDRDRIARVLAPKAFGAWHLDELTAHLPLAAFVLFSSATSMVGNRGQANYAVANTFLDHLAQARHAGGRRVLAVNWGAITDVGYVARHDDVGRVVATTGMRGFGSAQAFDALTALWHGQLPQAGVLPMDWPQFFRHHGLTPDTQPRYEHVPAVSHASAQTAVSSGPLRRQLRTSSASDRRGLVVEALTGRLAAVLGIPLDTLDQEMPLMDYLDSLLAVEISSWLERELETKITIMELMKGPSVLRLADRVLVQLDEQR
ncbi:type I polyketide synthase [Nocardia wallacei]|uniref:type I polyketide synthase n=1 Tax=Nocardia wallacei TaxID=480035 RepID=UPI002456CBD6|nr:type I polyketide synthase [Nocardia wallacei]